jgi:hypothetical protein
MFIWHNIGLHDRAVETSSLQLFVDEVLPRFATVPSGAGHAGKVA